MRTWKATRDQLGGLVEGDGTTFVSVFDPAVNSGQSFSVHRYFFGHRNVPLQVNHVSNLAHIDARSNGSSHDHVHSQ
jgi:hypothetical protein